MTARDTIDEMRALCTQHESAAIETYGEDAGLRNARMLGESSPFMHITRERVTPVGKRG